MSLPVLGPVYIIAIRTAASVSIQLQCPLSSTTATTEATHRVGTYLGTLAIIIQAFINI
jgi:hypothetical protein